MDKNVLAAIRQLEDALDAAIEHGDSTAELNAYFIMEQKVWSACGTCAQDLFWANKTSAKTEAAPEEEVQEQLSDSEFAQKREYLSILLFSASPEEQQIILKAMTEKKRIKENFQKQSEFLKSMI